MFKVIGKLPSGERLERIERSPNYRNGRFHNVEPTQVMREGANIFKLLKDFFTKPETVTPKTRLPSVKEKLKDSHEPLITWFGHSSYLIRTMGYSLLVDPVFSKYASPLPPFGKAFKGSNVYETNDLPEIDYLLITHDHYDHLDHETVIKLNSKTKNFITPLGVGSHLEYWGIEKNKIIELDWWEQLKLNKDLTLTCTPSRHFSGRGFKRFKTLWCSFVIEAGKHKFFLGGDSGYDSQFKVIGEKFGPFDVAILDGAQYGQDWPQIHMVPEETVNAALDLKAKQLLPVHWAKFSLSTHHWTDPIIRILEAAKEKDIKVATPLIGQSFRPLVENPDRKWWLEV